MTSPPPEVNLWWKKDVSPTPGKSPAPPGTDCSETPATGQGAVRPLKKRQFGNHPITTAIGPHFRPIRLLVIPDELFCPLWKFPNVKLDYSPRHVSTPYMHWSCPNHVLSSFMAITHDNINSCVY